MTISLNANGTAGTVETTELVLTLSEDIDLVATDVEMTGATLDTLTDNNDGTYTLAISDLTVEDTKDVSVRLSRKGFSFSVPLLSAPVHIVKSADFVSLSANGTNGYVSTTELTLTLDNDIDLVKEDITLTGATLDTLVDNNDGTYILGISQLTVGNGENITASLAKYGFNLTHNSQNATVSYVEVVIFDSVIANGMPGTTTTTALTLTLNKDINLSADDITVAGATKGPLIDNNDGTYTLGISEINAINGGAINVALAKFAYSFAPSSLEVNINKQITFDSLSANGSFGTSTTSLLTLTLSEDINLVASDITLTGASKGFLVDNNNGTYSLSISNITVGNGKSVTVGITKSGYSFTSKAVVINKQVIWNSFYADGSSGNWTSSTLYFMFSEDIGLTMNDITLSGCIPNSFYNNGNGNYSISITYAGLNYGTASVTVNKAGYEFLGTRSTSLFKAISLMNVSTNGSSSITTTAIYFSISEPIDISAKDISVSGATVTGLSINSSGVYTATIGDIDTTGISYANMYVYCGWGSLNTGLTIYQVPTFKSVTANGTSNSVTTTALTITMDKDYNLTTSNIAVTYGASGKGTVGSVVDNNDGTYTINISGWTSDIPNNGLVTVKVTIGTWSSTKSVTIYKLVTFSGVSANGASGTTTTTALTLIFNADMNFTASEVTITGATKGTLVDNNNGTYRLSISNITVGNGGTVTVKVTRTGYTFTQYSVTVWKLI